MNDLLKTLPKGVVTFAVSIASLAAGASGWVYFGLPVPMTTEMHSEYHGHEAAVKSARSTLAFANKQLGRFDEGTPEYQEALEFRNSARDRLASLEN